MEEKLTNDIDENQNGIPDWFESREDDQTSFPEGDLGHAYTSEEKIAAKIPNYKEYKWYQNPAVEGHPDTAYFYTLGEKVENKIESGEITPDELPEGSAIQKEAEQLYDSNPNNDEVNNEAIKEISQEDFNKMSLDDIEKADAEAMKGEGPTLFVEDSIDPDNRYSLDDSLNDFAEERFSVNWPQKKETLGDRAFEYTGKEIPEDEEKKEETKNTKNKFDKLKEFLSGFGGNVNTELPIEETSIEEKENTPITSGVRTAGFSFLGNSGGSASPASIRSTNADIDSNNDSNSGHPTNRNTPSVAEMDGNIASTNGANKVEHLDDTMDSLSFKDTEHEENIKTNEQADLPSGETWKENNDHWELPDIKEMMTKQGGGTYLPFKFTVEDGELYISQIGTGRKLPFDDFLKAEPMAGKQIIEVMNGDK
jgi:hypothetical protein